MNARTRSRRVADVVYFFYLRDKMSRKTLRVDDFGTSLIPRDGNDTAVLSLDLMEKEFVALASI